MTKFLNCVMAAILLLILSLVKITQGSLNYETKSYMALKKKGQDC